MATLPAVLSLSESYVAEVAVAPEALTGKLRASINVKPRRALGVLKIGPEWVGLIAGNEFMVWERRDHAMRARGRIRARRGGSRVEVELALTRRARILTLVFFALFAIAAAGLIASDRGAYIGVAGVAVAVAGGLAILVFFWVAALRQRAALRALLDGVFDVPTA